MSNDKIFEVVTNVKSSPIHIKEFLSIFNLFFLFNLLDQAKDLFYDLPINSFRPCI